ncbi:response regulator [Methanobrevibacter wolinii]|uniref:response regulator n=1 Tax=Methanobrevibacter wolinii TaxID=190977 RepID=UPI000A0374D0
MFIKSIIIIEDEAIISLDLYLELKDKGYTVYNADNYFSASKIIINKHPDLIIVDLILKEEGFNGIDIYKRFKDDNYKFIFISGINHSDELDNFIKSENIIFIDKPFVFDELYKHIKELL